MNIYMYVMNQFASSASRRTRFCSKPLSERSHGYDNNSLQILNISRLLINFQVSVEHLVPRQTLLVAFLLASTGNHALSDHVLVLYDFEDCYGSHASCPTLPQALV